MSPGPNISRQHIVVVYVTIKHLGTLFPCYIRSVIFRQCPFRRLFYTICTRQPVTRIKNKRVYSGMLEY